MAPSSKQRLAGARPSAAPAGRRSRAFRIEGIRVASGGRSAHPHGRAARDAVSRSAGSSGSACALDARGGVPAPLVRVRRSPDHFPLRRSQAAPRRSGLRPGSPGRPTASRIARGRIARRLNRVLGARSYLVSRLTISLDRPSGKQVRRIDARFLHGKRAFFYPRRNGFALRALAGAAAGGGGLLPLTSSGHTSRTNVAGWAARCAGRTDASRPACGRSG